MLWYHQWECNMIWIRSDRSAGKPKLKHISRARADELIMFWTENLSKKVTSKSSDYVLVLVYT